MMSGKEKYDMARGEITVRQAVRPCKAFYWRPSTDVPGEEKLVEVNGLWHMWRDGGREGIVEMTDGHIVYVEPKYIRFLDSDDVFIEYDWEKE